MMKRIVVIGSVSMDLVVTTKKRPQAGETVIGETFRTVPGGKGANQAIAAAKLGSNVQMVGCVGADEFGTRIRHNFEQNNVDTSRLMTLNTEVTGTAHIVLSEGDNSIVVVQSANQYVRFTEEELDDLLDNAFVLLQLEIPLETVEQVSAYCYERNIPVLLNPAPSQPLSEQLIEHVTYLTPNEHECRDLFGESSIEAILQKYPNKLIVTEGENGIRFFDGEKICHVPAIEVDVVDTTGAGDTFNGALAAGLVEGHSLEEAARYAVVASGMSVEGFGAQGGMPVHQEVMKRLERVQ